MHKNNTHLSNFKQYTKKNLNSAHSDQDTFERCPHDSENPYVMINRQLLRNKELSFEARGVLCFFLSFDNRWVFNVKQIIKSQGISRDRLYKIINELIEKGYVKREQTTSPKFQSVKYFVSETNKFKKCLPRPEIPYPEIPCPENTYIKNKQEDKKEQKEGLKKKKNKKEKERPTADALDFVKYFFKSLKESHPFLQQPDFDAWAYEIDQMLSKDKIPLKYIKLNVDYLKENPWFKSNILSPKDLRRKFLQIDSTRRENMISSQTNKNKTHVMFEKEMCQDDRFKNMIINRDYVLNSKNQKEVFFNMPHEQFLEVFNHIFKPSYSFD